MAVEGWRAFYTEGREYSSINTRWSDLPDDGMLAVTIYYDEWSGDTQYSSVLSGYDWYFHNPETGLFGGNSDTRDENERRYPDACLKRGKWAPRHEAEAARKKAHKEQCPR